MKKAVEYCFVLAVKCLSLLQMILIRRTNAVIVIKLDEIGDYILVRNFLPELKRTASGSNQRLVLVCSASWKELAAEIDGDIIDDFLEVDTSKNRSLAESWKLFRKASGYKVSLLVNASYSRKPISDYLSFLVNAGRKIAFKNQEQSNSLSNRIRQYTYHDKIQTGGAHIHEFERNVLFFSDILQREPDIKAPFLVSIPRSAFNFLFPYGLFFIGGTDPGRKWPVASVVALLGKLGIDMRVILVGGPADIKASREIMDLMGKSSNLIDLTGKTKLTDLPALIHNARWVVGNESGLLHMAAALNKLSICITGGGHFKRFMPYPDYMRSDVVSVFAPMPCFNCDWICIFGKERDAAYPCIAAIDASTVFQVMKEKEMI